MSSEFPDIYVKKLLRLSNVQSENLAKLKKNTGLNESEHMRRALDDYIDKMKWEGKL